MTAQLTQSTVDWKAYYLEEHKRHRFVPEQDRYEPHRVALAELLLEDATKHLGDTPRTILDVGCGDGNLVRTWEARHGLRALGSDLSPYRTAYARKHGQGTFLCSRADALPFVDDQFEAISMIEVLEHMEDPATVLRELRRVARKVVLVSVPYDQELVIQQCPHCLESFHVDGHIQRFAPETLRETAERAGFRVLNTRSYSIPSRWEDSLPGRILPGAMRRLVNGALVTSKLMARRKPKYLGAVLLVN